MEWSQIVAWNFLLVMGCMLALWALSVPLRNASIVDIFWGPGFALISALSLWLAEGYGPRQWLLAGMTVIWGLRLGAWLALRNVGHGEDPRYARWRKRIEARGGSFTWHSLVWVFGLQGVLMLVISLPVQFGQLAGSPARLGPLAWVGVALWAAGLFFEAVGDWQLRRFRSDPANRGRVLETGLWRYTRHPNYFGDALLWWGIWLVAADAPAAAWTVVGPVVMTALLLRFSGVPILEKSLTATRPGYADYVRRTSAFLPRPPKR